MLSNKNLTIQYDVVKFENWSKLSNKHSEIQIAKTEF